MKKLVVLISLLFVVIGGAMAQGVKGKVVDINGEPVVGATIYWAETNVGALSEVGGVFSIHRVKGFNKLITAYVGYQNDTLVVNSSMSDVVIRFEKSSMHINDIIIEGDNKGTYIQEDIITKTETISFAGLCKMACCSLAESFENSAAVTVGYSDAISGARQIKMLGLVGTYTQILDESRPIMRGLGAPYGLSYTPGMWLNSIQVSKGISSVTAGSEAITGQINLEYRKPTDKEKLFINGYINNEFRSELNVSTALPISKNGKLSSVLMLHGSMDSEEGSKDHNHDGFRDMPNSNQINIANRWLYKADDGGQLRFGFKVLEENRLGGEMGYSDSMRDDMFNGYNSSSNIYGSHIRNQEAGGYLKYGRPIGRGVYSKENEEELRSSIAIVADFTHFNEDAYFGLNDYRGIENSAYFNAMYLHQFNYNSSIIMGATATIRSIDEILINDIPFYNGGDNYMNDTQVMRFDRDENITGGYAEYTYKNDKFSMVLGARGDYNSYYKESYFTPRGQIKYTFLPKTTLRGSVGMGYRTTNILTDNIGILATGRKFVFEGGHPGELDRMEKALTAGGSLTHTFSIIGEDDATLSVDYFHTRFYNQVIVDQEYSSKDIYIYNSTEPSSTDSYQIDFIWNPTARWEIFATYRHTNSLITLERADGSLEAVERPLVSRFKTLLNLQYALPMRRWVFDATFQYNGPSRIPTMTGDLADSEMSPAYPMIFAQVSRKVGKFEIYAGCENIANYKQENPILSADNPFSTDFNSSVIWGPLMGRKFYAGFRFNLY